MRDFECRIVEDMDLLFVEARIPTGGRMTHEEAEALSVALWSAAQEVRRLLPARNLERANREAALKRAEKALSSRGRRPRKSPARKAS
jgi:hypothetical protein